MNRPSQADAITSERVLEHLQQICSSQVFCRSERMVSFLQHVVRSELTQDFGSLKEVCIGQAVFRRPADYDPKTDPIVRVEARRLRDKLERYYNSKEAETTLEIVLPRGGYRPQFIARETSPAKHAPLQSGAGVLSTMPSGPAPNFAALNLELCQRIRWRTHRVGCAVQEALHVCVVHAVKDEVGLRDTIAVRCEIASPGDLTKPLV